MAQATRERQPLMIAPRQNKPPAFGGTDAAWRVLCDLYPAAETPEIIMAVVEYCAAKRLDPFKGPVHVIPMWNSKLRRRVQTIMRGINEIEIVASRTGSWAGMDMPRWSDERDPAGLVERTFRGTIENDDGSTTTTEKTVRFPLWCAVTVYRLVGGERRAFTEQLFWEECYATAGFRSEVPNERWTKAPRQMLHKCTKAAVLRAAFPEEGLGYSWEEMEDQHTSSGGVTIEGRVDHGDPGLTDRDRRTDPPPPGEATAGLGLLDEQNGGRWIRNLQTLLTGAQTEAELVAIGGHSSVHKAKREAPTAIRGNITDWFREAHERVRPTIEEPPPDEAPSPTGEGWPDDPIRELLAEIEAMDLITLAGLQSNAQWRAKVRAACEMPPDEDRLNDAIAARRAALRGGNAT